MSQGLFSYTRRDYESLRKEGLSKLPLISDGKLTDLNASDPGVILVDYLHALVDMVQFYMDHQALEAFLPTAKERANILRLAKQFLYKVRSAKGARVMVRFTLPSVYNLPFLIPKHTKVSTQEGIEYLVLEDTTIPAGASYKDIECVQGEFVREYYSVYNRLGDNISQEFRLATDKTIDTGTILIEDSSGRTWIMNQTIILSSKNVDIDTIIIDDTTGHIWTMVDTLIHSTPEDYVFTAELLANGDTLVRFGDGIHGKYPAEEDVLTISYLSSLGEEGRVNSGKLIYLKSELIDPDGESTMLSVTNLNSSIGGSYEETDEEIRSNAPGVLKSQYRAVTIEDFETLAETIDGVRIAKAYDINNAPDLCLHHEVKVLVVPDQDTDSTPLRTQVYEFLRERMVPCNLTVLVPQEVIVNVSVSISRDTAFTEGSVDYDVTTAVQQYFDELEGDIGGSYNPNDLLIRIGSVKRVKSVLSLTPSTTIPSNLVSTIKLGTLSVEVI